MRLRAVFIDAGNTLLDEACSRFEIYAAEARAEGFAVSAERMKSWMGAVHDELPRVVDDGYRYSDPWFRAFIESIFVGRLGLARSRLAALQERLFERFSNPATYRAFPGAAELLRDLRAAGLVVGIVSNWSPRLPRVLSGLGLGQGAVDLVVCSAEERVEKPDPEIFRRALERAGVSAGEALHAGDHPRKDVAGARSAGLDALLVDHFAAHPKFGPGRVESLPELGRRVLERLSSGPGAPRGAADRPRA